MSSILNDRNSFSRWACCVGSLRCCSTHHSLTAFVVAVLSLCSAFLPLNQMKNPGRYYWDTPMQNTNIEFEIKPSPPSSKLSSSALVWQTKSPQERVVKWKNCVSAAAAASSAARIQTRLTSYILSYIMLSHVCLYLNPWNHLFPCPSSIFSINNSADTKEHTRPSCPQRFWGMLKTSCDL